MRAAVRTQYGGPGVVRFVDLPEPLPHVGELLVRMHATTGPAAARGRRRRVR